MSFQKITIYIASGMLIMCLLFVLYFVYRASYNSVFPPFISQCPDYWKVSDPNICNDTHNIMPQSNVNSFPECKRSMDFNATKFQGQLGMQNKYNWSRICNVSWDGITNNEEFM